MELFSYLIFLLSWKLVLDKYMLLLINLFNWIKLK